jgi:hypothetical protein
MLRWYSAQGAHEAMEGEKRTDQFEMLKEYILEEFYPQEEVVGWDPSEMKRPDRETVLRLIKFFSSK